MLQRTLGAVSVFLVMLMAPLFGQNGISISLFEYPEPIGFSKERHFINGRGSFLTLLVTTSFNTDNNFDQWDLSIKAEDNLRSDTYSIPISSVWAKAKGSPRVRSKGKVFLSTEYQTIARKKPDPSNSKNTFIEVKLKAFNGKHFLKPAGEYSTYIYFTITMD